MSRIIALLLALVLPGIAAAQSPGTNGGYSAGVGCPLTGCPGITGFTGAVNLRAGLQISGSAQRFWLLGDYTQAPTTAGSSNVVNDILTSTGGTCSQAVVLSVQTVSGGGVTGTAIIHPGDCTVPPTDPVSFTSSNGGATPPTYSFSGHWGSTALPAAAVGSANSNFYLATNPNTANYGTENWVSGNNTGVMLASNSQHNVLIQGGCGGSAATLTLMLQNSVCIGVDAMRNMNGSVAGYSSFNHDLVAVGVSAFANLGISGPGVGPGTAVGSGAAANMNNSADISAYGYQSCDGAAVSGSQPNSYKALCVGEHSAGAVTTAHQFMMISPYGVGNTTCASGSDFALFATSAEASAVDCPAAGTSHYWNFGNIMVWSSASTTVAQYLGTFSGDFQVAGGAAIATSATYGFLGLPVSAGIPTGAPTYAGSGVANCEVDSTNGYLNCYYASAWHKIAFAAGAG